jgi:DNA-binding NarL/FixJ family response regulator
MPADESSKSSRRRGQTPKKERRHTNHHEDHNEGRTRLATLEEDVEIVAEVSRGEEVVPAALDALPDVALLDIEMPGGDGLSAAAALKESLPSCHVVILTTF